MQFNSFKYSVRLIHAWYSFLRSKSSFLNLEIILSLFTKEKKYKYIFLQVT